MAAEASFSILERPEMVDSVTIASSYSTFVKYLKIFVRFLLKCSNQGRLPTRPISEVVASIEQITPSTYATARLPSTYNVAAFLIVAFLIFYLSMCLSNFIQSLFLRRPVLNTPMLLPTILDTSRIFRGPRRRRVKMNEPVKVQLVKNQITLTEERTQNEVSIENVTEGKELIVRTPTPKKGSSESASISALSVVGEETRKGEALLAAEKVISIQRRVMKPHHSESKLEKNAEPPSDPPTETIEKEKPVEKREGAGLETPNVPYFYKEKIPHVGLLPMMAEYAVLAGCPECQIQPLVPITLRWHERNDNDVYVTGSFVDWETKIPLRKDIYGWVIELRLPRGHHEYRYIVNGKWAVDEKRHPTVAGKDGINHLLHL